MKRTTEMCIDTRQVGDVTVFDLSCKPKAWMDSLISEVDIHLKSKWRKILLNMGRVRRPNETMVQGLDSLRNKVEHAGGEFKIYNIKAIRRVTIACKLSSNFNTVFEDNEAEAVRSFA